MKMFKSILAGLAAGGLLLSQSAMAAAPVRVGTPVGDAEGQSIPPGSGPVLFALFAVLLVVTLPMIFDDDDDGFPTSP
jgi:hypothetical protein